MTKRTVGAIVALMLLVSSGVGLAANPSASLLPNSSQANNQSQASPRYGLGGKISLPPPGNWQQSGGPADNHPVAQPVSPNTLPVFGADVNIAGGNETSVSANPTNPLNFVAGANGTGRFTTTDGGATWNVGNLNGGGDPATAFDTAGRAYFAELGNTSNCPDLPYLYKSTNGGLTWTGPANPLSDPDPTTHFFDKEWITVDNNASSPHLGRIYMTASIFHTPAGCDLSNYIDNREVIAYSDDQGATWSSTTTVSDASHNQDQFTKPVAASDGTVYVTYQYQNCTYNCNGIPAYQMITKSSDGGMSWSPSITITGQPISYTGSSVAGYQYLYAGSTSSGFRHNDQPVSAVSPTNPNEVYALWSDGRFESTFVYQSVTGWHGDIVFSRSTDGGTTWSSPIKINDDNVQGKDQFFPWMTVGSDGTIHASWMDRRDTAVNGFPYREYYSQSTDGGLTWSANQAVADVGGIPSSFIGDYSGIDVNANNSIVMPIWTDSRSGQNVYVDPGLISSGTTTPTSTPGATNTATSTPLAATATPTLAATATDTPVMTATDTPVMTTTNTPVITETATPVITETATPAATATDCPNVFTDITDNVFYGAIHYLACRGVVNGIDATHYNPGGTSTRGQFAKVVVLGFGIPLSTPTTADFTDVPPTYFAYVYIESGFAHGILSGFDAQACANLGLIYPCYGPNLAITRSQLTKLVVNAGGYAPYTPTTPDFLDVPPTYVFYVSIETAFHNSIIAGYADHTFRPNNNIRRDEMAQIVFEGIVHMP